MSTPPSIRLAALLWTTLVLPSVASGQANPPPPSPATPPTEVEPAFADDNWNVQLVMRAWYVAPAGDLTLPATGPVGQAVKLSTLGADEPVLAPFGELTIKAGDWAFTFSGLNLQSDQTVTSSTTYQIGDVAITPGNVVETRLDISTFNFDVGYRLVNHPFDATGDNAFRLYVLGGIRVEDIDARVTRTGVGGATSQHGFFDIQLLAGTRATMQFTRQIGVDVELNGGIGAESVTIDVAAAFSYRPVDWAAVQVGYRLLGLGASDGSGAGEGKFEGTLAGLFAGIVIRF